MTKNILENFRRLPNEARQVHSAANENRIKSERSEKDFDLSGIVRNEMFHNKKSVGNALNLNIPNMFVVLTLVTMMSSGCQKLRNDLLDEFPVPGNKVVNYAKTVLVADTTGYNAARIDSTLKNAWGIAINPSGIFWINVNGTDGSEIYDLNGVAKRPPVSVPSPSGIVFNNTTDFIIPASGTPAKFIFASENGKIYAWNSGDSAMTVVNRTAWNSVYKGLELANDGGDNFLYATDFRNSKIDVFDKSFNLVTTKPFIDPMIPSGFGPFNVRLIDSVLYVTYAKLLPPENLDDDKGLGNGYVDIFKTDGSYVKRFASQGTLNSPWGIEKAPEGFGQGKNAILIGNFGDGRINVFENKKCEFVRQLKSYGMPLAIDGLWAITFPDNNVPGDNPDKLYFTAGPNDESHGVFGYLLNQ
jgi:uncharacterized protein (TIGR03118 family)